MKEAKDFLPLISLDPRQAVVLFEIIQKDAYNQAIEDAANTMDSQSTLTLPQQTILKLKK